MISIIFGLLMGFAQYYSKPFCRYCYTYKMHLVSFSAGIFLTYVIFKLFPLFSIGAVEINTFLYITILIGFISFYLIEKYIYQHHSKQKRLAELALTDSTISFIYHFIIGMFIAIFTRVSAIEGLLFTIPTLIQTSVSSLPFDSTRNKTVKIVLSSSTMLGILFSEYIYPNPDLVIYYSLLGFVIGSLLFVVTRHSLPFGRRGEPLYFGIGVVLYTALLSIL